MEVLNVLEKKIANLIELIKSLRAERELLVAQNVQLKEQLDTLENSLLTRNKHVEERSHEIELTKIVVDDLIKSIDLLVEQEQRQ